MQKTIPLTAVAREMLEGLKAPEKKISSKFFYDARGSRIFQQIMQMPEYYLTGCEAEIFESFGAEISNMFCDDCSAVELVELGAGDGAKTGILIREMLDAEKHFRYIPVDISEEALLQLGASMRQQFPELKLELLCGDYFHMIEELSGITTHRKVVLFLGSNLGNYEPEQSVRFLSQINQAMSQDDLFFIGLDLKKDPAIIRAAYDDPHGLTREFNLNLLHRFNRELGGDFITDQFIHVARYNPENGRVESFLESTCDQQAHVSFTGETITFTEGETIHTELSQKYDLEMIRHLASVSGFMVVKNFFDSRHYFVSSLWKKL